MTFGPFSRGWQERQTVALITAKRHKASPLCSRANLPQTEPPKVVALVLGV
jgi:hypothetical protein